MSGSLPAPRCVHCKTSLTDAQRAAGAAFCCTGCETARALLTSLVDARRFDLLGGAPTPVNPAPIDEAALTALRARLPEHGLAHLDLDVEGVTCASCAWLVESVAKKTSGVNNATLNSALGRLSLAIDADRFDVLQLARALARLGHAIGPPQRTRDALTDELVARLGVTAALAMAAMMFAFSFYFGLQEQDPIGRVFSVGQLVAGVLAVVVGGQPFFRAAWAGLRARALTMDVPIALGMLLALAASIATVWVGGHAVYFDTVAVFVTLMLLGRLLERRVVERNRRLLLAHDGDVAQLSVRRIMDGTVEHVPVSALRMGDVMQLAPGELVPVDCALQDDVRSVSRAWITGESDPETLQAGAAIPAGAHNVDARPLRARVVSPFASSRLAALLAPPGARAPDAFFTTLARAWVVGVFAVAAVAVALWWSAGPMALLHVLAPLLVVTCPCAFGIAAPLAIERAHATLRRAGVFVRSPSFLARVRTVRAVVFDKTGTLTSGAMELCNPDALEQLTEHERAALAALCGASNHPHSRALWSALGRQCSAPLDVVEQPGVGVGVADGTFFLGRTDARDGTVFLSQGVERARFAFREQLRAGTRDEVRQLQAMGLPVFITSGDDAARTQALAARLGIPADHAWGGLLPEQKRARVQAIHGGAVLYVGDGLNDALAFEAARCAGTPAVDRPQLPQRADFFLLGGALSSLVAAVQLSRRLRRVLVSLLSVATVYNAVVIGCGLLGLLSPLIVAVVMPAMSLSLVSAAALAVRLPQPPAAPSGAPLFEQVAA